MPPSRTARIRLPASPAWWSPPRILPAHEVARRIVGVDRSQAARHVVREGAIPVPLVSQFGGEPCCRRRCSPWDSPPSWSAAQPIGDAAAPIPRRVLDHRLVPRVRRAGHRPVRRGHAGDSVQGVVMILRPLRRRSPRRIGGAERVTARNYASWPRSRGAHMKVKCRTRG